MRGHLDELNGIDVSPDLISTINDAVGSGRGGERAAIYTALETARLNGIDPEGWLTEVAREACRRSRQPDLDHLLPWNWRREPARLAA